MQAAIGLPASHEGGRAAIEEMDPRRFVERLEVQALFNRAVRHPYLKHLSAGTLPDMRRALSEFAHYYYGYAAHFTNYLRYTILRFRDTQLTTALVDNLLEEIGHYGAADISALEARGLRREWFVGVAHSLLFRRFREALGVVGETGIDAMISTCWREMFQSVLQQGSPAEAVGAMGFGTENIVRPVYARILAGLKHVDLPPEATVFFPLHLGVDDKHRAGLKALAIELAETAEGRRGLERGMRKALLLRAGFWDFLLERALGGALEDSDD